MVAAFEGDDAIEFETFAKYVASRTSGQSGVSRPLLGRNSLERAASTHSATFYLKTLTCVHLMLSRIVEDGDKVYKEDRSRLKVDNTI